MLLWLLGLLTLASPTHPAEAPKAAECLACHAAKDLQRGAPGPGRSRSVFVDAAVLKGSIHARLECVACHATATAPHEERLPAVRCASCHENARDDLGAGVHGSGKVPAKTPAPTCTSCHGTHAVRPASSLSVEGCAACHGEQVHLYEDSIHGRSRRRGNPEAATCRSCHGATHALLASSDSRAPTYHLNLPRTCAQCHGDPELARRHNIPVGNVYQLYMDSIHGRAVSRSGLLVAANCSDCHGVHDIRPSTEPASLAFRENIPRTCGKCHAGVLAEYRESVHGQATAAGNAAAPVCTDCHTAHQIRRVDEPSWQLQEIRECGTCHEELLKSYRDTFHGKVTALGFTRVAKCSDCHGSHTILPASDPRSSVSAAKIVSTCRPCHAEATLSFTEFDPHPDPLNKKRFPLLYYTYVLMNGLLLGTFAFFGLHTILWYLRSLVDRFRPRRASEEASPEP